jgi:aspartate/tyrosine/aromatic aminotransferase
VGVEIETSSCVVAHELNEEWASTIKKYVKNFEEMRVEFCATIKELEEFVAMISQQ